MIDADETLARFTRTLRTYDDPHVARVAAALADSTPLSIETPALEPEAWLSVLETTAGELYLAASDDEYGTRTRWYVRHDGAAFIYGTKQIGELYRGPEGTNAYRQVRSVVTNHDVTPYPMGNYPLEVADEYQEVPADQ
ncbi:hypothetical protein DVR14_00810 (plasmid) [Natrinema thermotolerans]|nr:hypothetical protein DVR14_00810 [Natrinema thermotolerans]